MRKFAFPFVIVAAAAAPAAGQDATVGLAAPLTGPSAILGQQLRDGAQRAAEAETAMLEIADDGCTAQGGVAAARAFIAAKVTLATGFLCTEALDAALPLLKDAGIATLVTGVRSNALTDRRLKTGWLVARLSPRADAEMHAAVDILSERWRSIPFAIVDDGTIYSRDLAEGLRAGLELKGLRAAYTDTFRPQLENQVALVGRLRRSGATEIFVAGDRTDVAIIGRDAGLRGTPLTIIGGEVLRAAADEVDLVDGTLMIGLPEWREIADPAVVASLGQAGIEPEGYVLPGYASVQVAAQAMRRAAAASGARPLDQMLGEEFQTVIGPVGFTQGGDRTDNPYRLFRFLGGKFEPVE